MSEPVAVVIPAFNEAAVLGGLLDEVRAAVPEALIVVVNDGSTDGTAAVAAAHGAEVLSLPFNCGIGAAVRAGLHVARRADAHAVVRLDGDGQHDPAAIPALLAPLIAGGADFVIGSRFLGGDGFRPSAARRLGIRWFSWLLALAVGRRFTDPTSGFFAAGRQALAFLDRESASDYPEVEALVRLARAGYQVREVPVRMRGRLAGRSSIAGLAPVRYMVKVTLALLAARIATRAQPG